MKTSFINSQYLISKILCPTISGIVFCLLFWAGSAQASCPIPPNPGQCICHNINHNENLEICPSAQGIVDGHDDHLACFDGDGFIDGKKCSVEDSCGKCNGCGNGEPDPGEQCDDGNNVSGDGCSADCKTECKTDGDCNDNNVCTDDTCNQSTHFCEHTNNTAPCEDGNLCTVGDQCLNGTCGAGAPKVCADPAQCFNPGVCNASTGDCDYAPRQAGSSCTDPNKCNGDESCDGSGNCVTGAPTTCDDGNTCTSDSCDTGSGDCSFTPQVGASCSDNNICTLADTCNADGQCVSGAVNPCDDSNSCTTDSCNAQSATDGGNGCVSVDNGTCGGAFVPGPNFPQFLEGNKAGCSLQTGAGAAGSQAGLGLLVFSMMIIPLVRISKLGVWGKNRK